MKKFLKILTIITVILLLVAGIVWFAFLRPAPPPISDVDRVQLKAMPLPAKLKLKKGTFVIPQKWSIDYSDVRTTRLERAVDRLFIGMTKLTGMNSSFEPGTLLVISCSNESEPHPTFHEDESYTLTVTTKQIVLKAPTERGILHGLETLEQLIQRKEDNWVIPVVEIEDHPRYPWRGLMIDVGRHWIPKEVILRNLDAMAQVKLNVLHLHLSEYQGFRVESRHFPRLHEMGSEGHYFSHEDIRDLVQYAADRGIRIVPEFDLPGHSTSWLVGYPELGSAPGPYTLDSLIGVLDPVLNPTSDTVYQFLDEFVSEMAGLFPDSVMHIGGDEVKLTHWNNNPQIQDFILQNNLADGHGLQAYFNLRIQEILQKHGKRMMGWDEILHPDLPASGIIIQPWRDQKSLWNAAKQAYDGVLSAGYYLDYKQPAGKHYQVDPEVIPGAITIDIDSMHWKSWKTTTKFQDTEIEGDLYLFGEGPELRGIIRTMGNTSAFTNPLWDGPTLTFSHESSFGKVNYELTEEGDSLTGETNIALFSLDFYGVRSGGSDLPEGEPLPEFEKIEPLTSIQAGHILGGEACIWTEMVSDQTLESRIWPRMAAMAEKWWSPRSLTNNVEDMYRRLWITEDRLLQHGLQAHALQHDLLAAIAGSWSKNVQDFADVLQEDQFFNRMAIYPQPYHVKIPLNRMVDAAMPESRVAYLFNLSAQNWTTMPTDSIREELLSSLDQWMEIDQPINEKLADHPRLQEVAVHAEHLSQLAELAKDKLTGNPLRMSSREVEQLLSDSREAAGGTVLAVVEGMQKILN